MREPTVFDCERGLAKAQYSFEDGPWVDGYPPRIGKPGTKVHLRYVWVKNPETQETK